MNRFFASAFAVIIGLVHFLMVATVIALLLANFPNMNNVSQAVFHFLRENAIQIPPLEIIALAAVGYVLVTGRLSTFIAINQNLERMNSSIEKLKTESMK